MYIHIFLQRFFYENVANTDIGVIKKRLRSQTPTECNDNNVSSITMSSFNRVLIQSTLYNSMTVSYILQRVSLLRNIKIPIPTSHDLPELRNLTMTFSVSIIVVFNKFRFHRETAIVEYSHRPIRLVRRFFKSSIRMFAIKAFDLASTDTCSLWG